MNKTMMRVTFSDEKTVVARVGNIEAATPAEALQVACKKQGDDSEYRFRRTETMHPYRGATYERHTYGVGNLKAIVSPD